MVDLNRLAKDKAHRVMEPLLLLAAVYLAVILGGCESRDHRLTSATTTGDSDTMTATALAVTANRKLPPIDLEAPQRTETATFALG
jgi:hypothetical protein